MLSGLPHGDFDWNLLKTFRAVARCGSVSAAARELRREQPSVSAALRRLEDHFGVPLCERSSRGTVLTSAGRTVFEATGEILRRIESLDAALMANDQDDATLDLRMISDVVAPALDRAMTTFRHDFPRAGIRIDIAPWRRVIEAVERNDATLGIACDSRPSDRLAYRALIEEAQQLYCGPGHPLFGSGPLAPDDLLDETFVLTGEDEPEELTRFRAAYRLGRHPGASVDTLHEARKLIQVGVGIGFLPTVVAEANEPPLWPLLPDAILPRYPLYLVVKRQAQRAPRVQQLLDAFLAEIPPLPRPAPIAA